MPIFLWEHQGVHIQNSSQPINQEITAPEVRLIDENNRQLGIVSLDQALYLAYEKGLDLVEVSTTANPPVCKLLEYSKFKYEQEKQERQQRAKGKTPDMKEIRLSLKIGEHDLQVKAKRAKEFIEKGSRVRANLQLRGREMMFQDKAIAMIDSFRLMLGAEYEQAPSKLGNRFNAILKRGKDDAKTKDS